MFPVGQQQCGPQLSNESAAWRPLGTVKLGKMACSVAELLGVAWGSRLQVIGRNGTGHLVPFDEDVLQAGLGDTLPENGAFLPPQCPGLHFVLAANSTVLYVGSALLDCRANGLASILRAASGANNNSKLVDDNTAQQLRHEEIEQMKLDGRGGRAIVDAVVKNSATFAAKTEYAKEKYVRKKQKKCVSQIGPNCVACDVNSVGCGTGTCSSLLCCARQPERCARPTMSRIRRRSGECSG